MRITTALPLVLLFAASSAFAAPREYDLKGSVIEVHPAEKSIVIHHEAIPDFMMEMTMPFDVKDARVLDGITTGDLVAGKLAVTEDDAWLTTLSVTGKAPPRARVERKPAFLQQDDGGVIELGEVKLLEPGDEVPDFAFEDQAGTSRTLHALRGNAVAITFIYTRCPLPNFCPAISRNFTRVQEIVKQEGITSGVHLITVSFDPEYDTPEILHEYGKGQKADFSISSFVRSDPKSTHEFGRHFGLAYEGAGTDISHNMRSIIISPDGKLVEMVTGSAWDANDFARKLIAAARR
jgi:protein SCO1